jgi:gamma-glutamyltranspeptidase/glutathione hydrolase
MTWDNFGTTHRPTVMGMHGMVAAAHPLASLAGLRMLMAGGNAIDAAIATAAALNVAEPFMSGLGGGGTMLVHPASGETVTLHYGGNFPTEASVDTLDAASIDIGPKASSVPGAPAGWLAALDRYGTMDAATVFAPAIEYAENGFALTVKGSAFFASGAQRLGDSARAIYFPGGSPPASGALIRNPQLAETYRNLARDGADGFYNGPIGKEIVRSLRAAGGLITEKDMAQPQVSWIAPSVSTYRGYEVRTTGWPLTSYEIQLTLNILEGFDLATSAPGTVDTLHTFLETLKLSMTERVNYAGRSTPPSPALLSKGYADARRALIDPLRATPFGGERFTQNLPPGSFTPGDPTAFLHEQTTHFDVVDAEGNAVSVTQSLGAVFGSGFLAGNTGIMMNNFLFFFDLDPASPNAIKPNDGVRHGPLSPTMLFDGDRLFLAIGTPGAFGIPQTTAQMISNVVDHRYGVQAAIEAPRFRVLADRTVLMENRVDSDVRAELTRRGHDIQLLSAYDWAVGGGHGVLIDPETGALSGGADPRRDGYALGW